MIDLNLVLRELNHLKTIPTESHFNKMVIDDAISIIEDDVIQEYNVTSVNGIKDIIRMFSNKNFDDYLTFNRVLYLVQGASIGLCSTYNIYKRYLSESDFELWKNDKLDLSKFEGHKHDLEDVYLETKALYKAFKLIERIVMTITELQTD